MCLGIPMQVIESGLGYSLCDYQGTQRRIDTMLVGQQPVGTWLLIFIDAAREVIAEEDALKINDALSALNTVMAGGEADIGNVFADIMEDSGGNPEDAR